ncbi:uncharacterized protein E0L32_009797 [Thyridium curvatum]|uniref:Uncharacterized protein n=1 Tax=Thyridium curvatum TaxID=1093900 RepID=A0A507AGA8_9PEZI|nr:uncharacterized protein E0L32_009797 [Thyridium curvatum]TPX08735.1 hypothetical protein E0L32_009797 [Thyridium curvatum]
MSKVMGGLASETAIRPPPRLPNLRPALAGAAARPDASRGWFRHGVHDSGPRCLPPTAGPDHVVARLAQPEADASRLLQHRRAEPHRGSHTGDTALRGAHTKG